MKSFVASRGNSFHYCAQELGEQLDYIDTSRRLRGTGLNECIVRTPAYRHLSVNPMFVLI